MILINVIILFIFSRLISRRRLRFFDNKFINNFKISRIRNLYINSFDTNFIKIIKLLP